jgi:hypothetical protein
MTMLFELSDARNFEHFYILADRIMLVREKSFKIGDIWSMVKISSDCVRSCRANEFTSHHFVLSASFRSMGESDDAKSGELMTVIWKLWQCRRDGSWQIKQMEERTSSQCQLLKWGLMQLLFHETFQSRRLAEPHIREFIRPADVAEMEGTMLKIWTWTIGISWKSSKLHINSDLASQQELTCEVAFQGKKRGETVFRSSFEQRDELSSHSTFCIQTNHCKNSRPSVQSSHERREPSSD